MGAWLKSLISPILHFKAICREQGQKRSSQEAYLLCQGAGPLSHILFALDQERNLDGLVPVSHFTKRNFSKTDIRPLVMGFSHNSRDGLL